jgi:hypothetical protein
MIDVNGYGIIEGILPFAVGSCQSTRSLTQITPLRPIYFHFACACMQLHVGEKKPFARYEHASS